MYTPNRNGYLLTWEEYTDLLYYIDLVNNVDNVLDREDTIRLNELLYKLNNDGEEKNA